MFATSKTKIVHKERRQQATVLEGRKRERERERASYRLGGQGKRGEGERGKHKYVQRELHVYNDATFVCVYSAGGRPGI